jgi:hypothetical protein
MSENRNFGSLNQQEKLDLCAPIMDSLARINRRVDDWVVTDVDIPGFGSNWRINYDAPVIFKRSVAQNAMLGANKEESLTGEEKSLNSMPEILGLSKQDRQLMLLTEILTELREIKSKIQ